MAINFPSNPALNDEFTSGGTTWRYDGTAWIVISNIQDTSTPTFLNLTDTPGVYEADKFIKVNATSTALEFADLTQNSFGSVIIPNEGTASANTPGDDLVLVAGLGMNITVDTQSNTLTFDASASGSGDTFNTIITDDGQAIADGETTLNVIGGTNISTDLATDTTNLRINVTPFGIDFLSDVDTVSSPPTTGQVLKWNGSSWAPGIDATTGGAGTDADTLDGFDGSYYLDYNNFNNTPTVATLSSFSIGNELSPSGDGAISYDNTTGVFRYTPPNLSLYALTSSVFSGDYNDLSNKPTIPSVLTDLGIADGTTGQVLTTDGSGNFSFSDVSGGGGDSGILNVVEDTTPQLGGNLDVNGNEITGTTVAITSSSNGNITITPNGTGQTQIARLVASNIQYPTSDGGAGQFLSTNGSGVLSFSNAPTPQVSFSDLTNHPSGYTIDEIMEAAIVTLRVDNVSTTSYRFPSHYGTTDNPTIYALNGTTIAFDLNGVPGHPFAIQDSTGTNLTSGLVHIDTDGTVSTDSNAQGKSSGTLYWRIPVSISSPPNYRYQCLSHTNMVGPITIKDFSSI